MASTHMSGRVGAGGSYLAGTIRDVDHPVSAATGMGRVELVHIDRPGIPSADAGETLIITVASAIANAIFAATGARIRTLPLQAEMQRAHDAPMVVKS